MQLFLFCACKEAGCVSEKWIMSFFLHSHARSLPVSGEHVWWQIANDKWFMANLLTLGWIVKSKLLADYGVKLRLARPNENYSVEAIALSNQAKQARPKSNGDPHIFKLNCWSQRLAENGFVSMRIYPASIGIEGEGYPGYHLQACVLIIIYNYNHVSFYFSFTSPWVAIMVVIHSDLPPQTPKDNFALVENSVNKLAMNCWSVKKCGLQMFSFSLLMACTQKSEANHFMRGKKTPETDSLIKIGPVIKLMF